MYFTLNTYTYFKFYNVNNLTFTKGIKILKLHYLIKGSFWWKGGPSAVVLCGLLLKMQEAIRVEVLLLAFLALAFAGLKRQMANSYGGSAAKLAAPLPIMFMYSFLKAPQWCWGVKTIIVCQPLVKIEMPPLHVWGGWNPVNLGKLLSKILMLMWCYEFNLSMRYYTEKFCIKS